MTIKKRLFLSNILMILVPVISTALIGLLCVAFMWLTVINGAGLDLQNSEDFSRACYAVTETVVERLHSGYSLDILDPLLESNGMTVSVTEDGALFYTFGAFDNQDNQLLSAAALLGNDAIITQNGKNLFVQAVTVKGHTYQISIFSGSVSEQGYANIRVSLAVSAIVIVFTIFLSILFTNRFLTKFVFRKIEEPLNTLVSGVHELRDGNLEYRIAYDRQDEFLPVCNDFNEMAGKLQELVQKTLQQERSRKELIAGISHDIRSPLTSIRAYVEGLLDGVAKTPDTQRRYLETVKGKAEEMEHMISQLFLFSKMELGDYPENLSQIRLDQTISNAILMLKEEYQKNGLSITMDMEPVEIQADPEQVQRIVTNLVENSAKYKCAEQGQLEITLHRTDDGFALSFADDGPGVPKESLPHLFEVFYRSDPARQNPAQGSGLGLAIVANAVTHMGGRITALESTMGGLEIRMDFRDTEEANG